MKNKWLTPIKAIPVVLILFGLQIWIYTNVPEWQPKIQIYMIITALMFAIGSWRIEKGITTTSFIKEIPKGIIFATVTFTGLYIIGSLIGGQALPSIALALAGVPLYLIMAHALVVSVDETYIFQAIIPEILRKRKIKKKTVYLMAGTIFALFHIAMSGFNWLLILPYIPLGMIFQYTGERWSRTTMIAAIGVHFGYNLFILAFGQHLGAII